MASSLLFRIKSVLDPSGFRSAQAAFTNMVTGIRQLDSEASKLGAVFSNLFGGTQRDALGVQVTKATSGLQALTGGLISLKAVGIATAVVGTAALVKGIQATTQEAAKSELASVRLKAQLEALGISGEDSFQRVQKFAESTALTTRFASDEVEKAVTQVVKRTGDLNVALRAVSIAQDIAAGSGQDLSSASLQVTQALIGNVRAIKLLTGARTSEIKSAVATGKILDLLEKRTKGLASAESTTLIVQQKILANTFDEISKTIGQSFLPAAKAVTGVLINLSRGVLVFTKNFDASRFAVAGLIGGLTNVDKLVVSFSKNLSQTGNIMSAISKTVKDLTSSITEQSREFANAAVEQGNLGLEVQKQEALLLKDADERIAKLREIADAEQILKQIQVGNLNEINKAKLESARKFKEVDEAIKAQQEADATELLEKRKADLVKLNKVFEEARKPQTDRPRREQDIIKETQEAAKLAGLTEAETNKEIERRLALLRQQNELLDQSIIKVKDISREALDQELAITGDSVNGASKSPLQTASEVTQPIADGLSQLANAVKSISPVINQTINPIALGNEIARIVEQKLREKDTRSRADARAKESTGQANASAS